LKDRLYTWKEDGDARRGSQMVIHEITSTLLRLMAPVLSFLAEEVYEFLPGAKQESIFFEEIPKVKKEWENLQVRTDFEKILGVREEVSKKVSAVTQAFGNRAYWLEFLGALQAVKPPDILITSIDMKPDGQVTLTGETEVFGSIAKFADDLAKLKDWVSGKPNLSSPEARFSLFIQKEAQTFQMTLQAKSKETRLAPARVTLPPGMTAPTATPTVQSGMMPGGPAPAGLPGGAKSAEGGMPPI
ncbi:MAG: class I tRNA ligase family protein, partial [Candidatus Sumerlaeaceae bacterium]|nr:class I tRNA ligase family protein [Candidatus Sumerlaeaceae bacterium]